MKTYAIGDIHGMLVHLNEALAFIEEDAKDSVAHVIFLGDYVDRGPQSRQVIERLMAGPSRPKHIWTCLKGNHDDMLIRHVRKDYEWLQGWMNHGGKETLKSFDQNPNFPTLAQFPAEHIAFLEELSLTCEDDHRFYVHAGWAPGSPLTDTPDPEVCMWIRQPFLTNNSFDWGKLIVHGHTITESRQPEYFPPFRLGIDTGAFISNGGRLTVACFEEGKAEPVKFWQTLPNHPDRLTNSEASENYV